VIANGSNEYGGLLINSSRGILFADSTENYAKVAGEVAARTANL
jgi:orotidine-5'-phosphate decarboxylase